MTKRSPITAALLLAIGVVWLLGPANASAADWDASFGGGDGRVFSPGMSAEPAPAVDVTKDSTGRLLTVAAHQGDALLVTRYLPDGTLDSSFGDPDGAGSEQGSGRVLIDGWELFPPYYHYETSPATIAVQTDGKILVGGSVIETDPDYLEEGHRCWAVARLDTDGSLDPSFSGAGRFLACDNPGKELYDIEPLRNGKILLAGAAHYMLGYVMRVGVVTRLDSEGNIDQTFGPKKNGSVFLQPGGRTEFAAVLDIITLPSGKIVGVGTWEGDLLIFRLRPNGTFDPRFGRRGMRVSGPTPGLRMCECSVAWGVNRDRHGRLVVVGNAAYSSFMTRYKPDGRFDRTFGRRGVVFESLRGKATRAHDLTIQRNGRIVVASGFGPRDGSTFALLRYTSRGRRDRSFFANGLLTLPSNPDSEALAVISDRTGRLVAAGAAVNNGNRGAVVTRLTP
jgi:uncharacterized delta-60 repeat protein